MDNNNNFYIILAIPVSLVIGVAIGVSYCRFSGVKEKSLSLEKEEQGFKAEVRDLKLELREFKIEVHNLMQKKECDLLLSLEEFKKQQEERYTLVVKCAEQKHLEKLQLCEDRVEFLFHEFVQSGLNFQNFKAEVNGDTPEVHAENKYEYLLQMKEYAQALGLDDREEDINANLKIIVDQYPNLMIEEDQDIGSLNESSIADFMEGLSLNLTEGLSLSLTDELSGDQGDVSFNNLIETGVEGLSLTGEESELEQ